MPNTYRCDDCDNLSCEDCYDRDPSIPIHCANFIPNMDEPELSTPLTPEAIKSILGGLSVSY
jgi:hypothetical protein